MANKQEGGSVQEDRIGKIQESLGGFLTEADGFNLGEAEVVLEKLSDKELSLLAGMGSEAERIRQARKLEEKEKK